MQKREFDLTHTAALDLTSRVMSICSAEIQREEQNPQPDQEKIAYWRYLSSRAHQDKSKVASSPHDHEHIAKVLYEYEDFI